MTKLVSLMSLTKKSLTTLIPAIAASVLLAGAAAAQDAKAGDAKAGEKKAAMCIGCHGIPGYQASFPEVHKVPMIAGQGAKYIVAALDEYKKGDRKHPTMRAIAAPLSDQDMADLAAFYEQLPKEQPKLADKAEATPQVAELLRKGNCVSCHGENFSKPIDGSYPKLAGQHADYLFVALKAYQTNGNPQIGRSNAIMVGQVKQFSHAELKTLAQYLASLPSELHTVPQSRFR
jgi:cytochrome c553